MAIAPDEKIDWFRIVIDLERSGYSHSSVASWVGVTKRAVGGWKQGATPRYEDGERLIALWCQVTKNGQESAHRVKRNSHLA